MTDAGYRGLLVIGDPHLEGRVPGFRKDEYPQVILEKFAWCLDYAKQNALLPAVLGDLFHLPRDNPTWMLGRLIELLSPQEVIGLYGNHDTNDPELSDHDSLSLLIKAGCLTLVDRSLPWRGCLNGRTVIIGGSSYRHPIPDAFDPDGEEVLEPLVFWLAHHDIGVPGYEEQGRIKPRELAGVDAVINGHIHRRLDPVQAGRTLWLTPGNISRRTRSEATETHVPAALRIDVDKEGWRHEHVTIPHRAFEDVFHETVIEEQIDTRESAFVTGLAQLQAQRTQTGAGLMAFLKQNVSQFDDEVAAEILTLAREVADDDDT
ncbi:MAG: metallophosphoesterase [Phycisphaeraceae bacterium]